MRSRWAGETVWSVDVVAAGYKFKNDSALLEGLNFQERKIGPQAGAGGCKPGRSS